MVKLFPIERDVWINLHAVAKMDGARMEVTLMSGETIKLASERMAALVYTITSERPEQD
jgi:hypothetical protein